MKAFTDIESLRHVVKRVRDNCDFHGRTYPTIVYKGTVKLHGTNGGVRVTGEDVVAQGRNRVLTIQSDNFGFAHFVSSRSSLFRKLADCVGSNDVTFYGEWCGQGIQKGVAVSQVARHFVIFQVYDHQNDKWVYLPEFEFLSSHMLTEANASDIFSITQIPSYEVSIDFTNPEPAADIITNLTYEVEHECPWGRFRGVSGIGEGIVWVPVEHHTLSDLWFKSKGVKHAKASSEKKQVQVDPAKVENLRALVTELLPEWRLEQGVFYLRENGFKLDTTSTGEYIKWIHKDVLKEETDVISANPFTWKEIVSPLSNAAREYYMKWLDREAFDEKA